MQNRSVLWQFPGPEKKFKQGWLRGQALENFLKGPGCCGGPRKNAQKPGGSCGRPRNWMQKRGGCSASPRPKTNQGGWLRSPLRNGKSKPQAAARPALLGRISVPVAARSERLWRSGESLDVVTSFTAASNWCCARLIGRPK